MEPQRVTASGLTEVSNPIDGVGEIEGFLWYRGDGGTGNADLAWLSVDEAAEEPVVRISKPDVVFAAFRGEVSARLGGRFLYANRVRITGHLGPADADETAGYLLSNLSAIDVWEDDELINIVIEPDLGTSGV